MSLQELPVFKDIDGNDISPDKFKGKVVFVINVASACGYTASGYDMIAGLTQKYPPNDFIAVAIPCNAFGRQENGTPEQIKAFALARAEKLIVTERSEVNGEAEHPIIQLAKKTFPEKIQWNFDGRYIFDRNGNAVAKFGNSSSITEIEAAIDEVM